MYFNTIHIIDLTKNGQVGCLKSVVDTFGNDIMLHNFQSTLLENLQHFFFFHEFTKVYCCCILQQKTDWSTKELYYYGKRNAFHSRHIESIQLNVTWRKCSDVDEPQ